MSRVALSTSRATLLACGLLAALVLTSPHPASATDSTVAAGSDASASIIHGKRASIRDWPWQVGITVAERVKPRLPTSRRFFCGGAILAPRLVITAGHCVAELNRRQVRLLEVVSGRTRLNSNQGQVARVIARRMPRNAEGYRRYRAILGAADWDVALLELATPLKAEPIELAGADEAGTWATGQKAWATGWGITKAWAKRVPASLRVADQVMMGNGLCRRADGVAFRTATMNCVGGPGGNASACSGDSGGALVVATTDGYRLAGLTSYGDGACRGFIPSVFTKVSGDPIRRWVERVARRVAGTTVTGSGAEPAPVPDWCRVPALRGLTPARARVALAERNCRLGKVRRDRWSVGHPGRIDGYSRLPGWLARPGGRIDVWIGV